MTRVLNRHPSIKVTLRWVPGHIDVEGNKLADMKAKYGVEGHSTTRTSLPPYLRKTLPRSVAKVRQEGKTKLQREAQDM